MIEREYYRLSYLASKWSCDPDDLLHLGIQDKVQLCANMHRTSVSQRKVLNPKTNIELPPLSDKYSAADRAIDQAYADKQAAWLENNSKRMPEGLAEIQYDDLLAIERANGAPVLIEQANVFTDKWEWVEYAEPVYVGIDDLCIVAHVVERIEREYFKSNPVVRGRRDDGSVTGNQWPWGAHETKLLRQLALAAEKWWKNYDPSQPDTAPTNEAVSEWLQSEQGVSKSLADRFATILRADDLPSGPRRSAGE